MATISEAAASAGWFRWRQVTAHIPPDCVLYRASSPNYTTGDVSQRLDADAVDFLAQVGVRGIASFNSVPYAAKWTALLAAAGIDYLHLPTPDRTPPSRADLDAAREFLLAKKCVLVHCGYGHGRTGTGVTAIQLYQTRGLLPPEEDWMAINYVETAEQVQALRYLAEELQQVWGWISSFCPHWFNLTISSDRADRHYEVLIRDWRPISRCLCNIFQSQPSFLDSYALVVRAGQIIS